MPITLKQLLASTLSVALAAGLLPASAGIAFAQDNPLATGTDELTLASYNELSADEADGIIVVMAEDGLSPLSFFGKSTDEQLADAGLDVTAKTEDAAGTTLLAAQPAAGQALGEAVRAAESVEGVAYAVPNYLLDLIEPLAEGDETTGASNSPTSEDTEETTTPDGEATAPDTNVTPAPLDTPSGTDDPISHNTTAATDRSSERDQYWLYAADLVDAWNYAKTEGDVTVAVVDSGAMLEHEDLQDVVLSDLAYDATTQKPLTSSSTSNGGDNRADGHGTHVAGIIGAMANNGVGIVGSSYNANILPINVVKAGTSSGSLLAVLEAYDYIIDLIESGKCNVRVVNLSLGSYKESNNFLLLKDSIEYARSEYGIATVCAGGNNGSSNFMYPGDYDACISVTALDVDGRDWRLSDHNLQKDIAAPGRYICSTVPYADDLALMAVEEAAELATETTTETTTETGTTTGTGSTTGADTGSDTGADAGAGSSGSGDNEAVAPEPEPEPEADTSLERYGYLSGTSMAAPVVAGTLALMFAAVPDATVDEAVAALTATATAVPDFEDESGIAGAINAEAALAYLIENHQITFSDVKEDAWYYEAVMFCAKNGIMTGYTDGSKRFGPEDPLTREMAARLLYNYLGNEAVAPETDKVDVMQGQWYSQAINWCVDEGIMTGYTDGSNRFGVGDVLTREQAAKVIATIAEADLETADDAKYLALNDHEDTTGWAVPYMIWAVDKGVLNGSKQNELLPTKHVTRAEMAQIMKNAIENALL